MTETAAPPAQERRRSAWITWRPWITTVVRIGLAVVLFTAGYAKVTEAPALQKMAVAAYRILPDSLTGPFGTGLPILEICLAALLVAGLATRFAAIAAGVLMLVFIGGIASVWARGLKIDCGCFGGGGATADPHYLRETLRDLGFLVMAGWVAVFPASRLSADRVLGVHAD